MRFPTLAGLLLLVGCGQLGEILDGVTLSETELQAAADNYSGALVAFRELEAFAVEVSQGTVDLTGAQLVAPSLENGWVGSIYFLSDLFPGGPGELTMTFAVIGPDGPGLETLLQRPLRAALAPRARLRRSPTTRCDRSAQPLAARRRGSP